jgi:hypothetical protein
MRPLRPKLFLQNDAASVGEARNKLTNLALKLANLALKVKLVKLAMKLAIILPVKPS